MLDLSQYTLRQLRLDPEFVLLRGTRRGDDHSRPTSVLVQAPAASSPSQTTLRTLQEDVSIRSELDPAFVVRSIATVTSDGRPMVILEDPAGTPLDLLLDGAMDIGYFLRISVRIAAALGHVHSRGFVHKNIKPANILVNEARDRAWLMGLGVASRLPRARHSAPISQFLVGTLAYMAPEQTGRMNRSIDSRSDLYALGATFYEMLTGTLPFTFSDPMDLVHSHVARQPTAPSEKITGVPRIVSLIVLKLLAKTAEERYQTAAGLEWDLQRCLHEWETRHALNEFPLGERDSPDRLLIPEKLYGRDSEVSALRDAFDRVVAGGAAEFVLVSGYSGIGKSSVVNELHKSFVQTRGFFASGKFDQYKRDIPYATLAQAFQSLIQQLLGNNDAGLAIWREALCTSLGPNARLIIDLVPELEIIIGPQPSPPDLPPHDARRRFHLTFRRFISAFARPAQPLVLFLDDLQWLDAATLDLVENLLTASELQHVLLIGAYRSNEVTAAHPLRQTLKAIETAGSVLKEISLSPLTPEHLQQLISETVRCERDRTEPLAQLVHEKTGGNPFFANRFLASLAEEGLLTFHHDATGWSWDLGRIRAKGYSDNLADLMVGKLARLSDKTQKAVQHLACLGNAAEISTLALVCGLTDVELHSLMEEALRADLLELRKDSYHFIHDRIEEAAYLLLPEAQRAEAHLRIGRLLAAYTPRDQRDDAIYEIVSQLNRGASLIFSQRERKELAELNLAAGRRAKAATAYASALKYLITSEGLLPEDCWEDDYPLIFAIQVIRAECEFLTGDLVSAEERLSKLSCRAEKLVDKSTVACLRSALYCTLNRTDRAVEICIEYLSEAGVDIKSHPSNEDVKEEYDGLWNQIGTRPIEALFDLPLIVDPKWRATIEVLTEILPPAYAFDVNLWDLVLLRVANLSSQYGNCDGSCYAYSCINTVIGGRFGNYRAGAKFGQLSLDLIEKKGLNRFQARVYFAWAHAVIPWSQHMRAGLPFVRRTLAITAETGDLTYTAYAYCFLISNRLTSADDLEDVQREAETALEFGQHARFVPVVDILTSQLGLIRSLRGLTREFGSFSSPPFDEYIFEQHLEAGAPYILCWYWIRKLQAQFYAGNYAQAVATAARARPLLRLIPGWFEEADYHFYTALATAAVSNLAAPDERLEHSKALAEHRRRLALWAENCSENFANRLALLDAEIARLEHRELEAELLYEQAIRCARQQGFIHNEGLAYELAARFYSARGLEAFEDFYLRKARRCYQQWGALGKVRDLLKRHPRLTENESAPHTELTSAAPIEQLDLTTVLKVSQAVSGEMDPDRLIEKIMRAAVEHAGARRGLLIAQQGDALSVQALATASGVDVIVKLAATNEESALPQSLVRYVMRTRETVTLEDAASWNLFFSDSYWDRHRTRSVLCLPLINQGKIVAVLYLENDLASGVFGPSRLAVLTLIASQAAMSIENTRLYRDLARREAKIQRLVDANILGTLIWDVDGTVLDCNDKFLQQLGYEREDLVAGRVRWSDFTVVGFGGRKRDDIIDEIIRTGTCQPIEWDHIRKDGSLMPALVGGATFEGETQGVAFVLDLTKHKQAEQVLRKSEAYLAEAQQLSQTGSWCHEIASQKVTYWSDEMFRIFGIDPKDGPPSHEEQVRLTHPEDRERTLRAFSDAVNEGRTFAIDYRHMVPDGTVKYMHTKGRPVLDKSGRVVEYIGTVIDATERRRTEQGLLVQYRVARILAEAATLNEATSRILQAMCECLDWDHGVLWRIDQDAGVLRAAEMWHPLGSVSPEFAAIVRAATYRKGSAIVGRVWESGTPVVVPNIGQNPAVRNGDVAAQEGFVSGFAFPILLGSEVLGVMSFMSRGGMRPADQKMLDIMTTLGSQIGQFAKRTMTVDELQLRVNLLHHIPVAAWSLTPDGTIDIVNSVWLEYSGHSPEYLNAHPDKWMATVHPEDREHASRVRDEGIRTGRAFANESRLRRASDGTYRWHLNRAVPVRDADGRILKFVGTSTDVHDWRQAQEALRNTQSEFAHVTRVMTMGELTASIAHEVNQPLGAIVTSAAAAARWLTSKPPQMDKARRALERIANDGKRAAEVIRRIRALMKRQSPRKEWLDINEVILEVIALAQYQLRKADILVTRRLGQELPRVHCDRVQLQQVLVNLILNAIEAMHGIKTRPHELTVVSRSEGPDAVDVEVRDSGTGLDPVHAAHLFEPFYTTKEEGLGVGLSISQSILEAHGGRLSVAANSPHGSIFTFSLPVNESTP